MLHIEPIKRYADNWRDAGLGRNTSIDHIDALIKEVERQRAINADLLAACQAALDFYEWHMSAVPSQVLEELVDRRASLQSQLRAAIDKAVQP